MENELLDQFASQLPMKRSASPDANLLWNVAWSDRDDDTLVTTDESTESYVDAALLTLEELQQNVARQ